MWSITSLFTQSVAEVMGARHIAYLEEAAERVAAAALLVAGVRSATVAVRKPHVPLPGPVECAEVTITRASGWMTWRSSPSAPTSAIGEQHLADAIQPSQRNRWSDAAGRLSGGGDGADRSRPSGTAS